MSNSSPKSPLTIIAIFAGIIEASALASLPFLGEDSQGIYTWFLVGFPPFLTLLFFLTLNFNTKSLYAPDSLDSLQPAVADNGHSHSHEQMLTLLRQQHAQPPGIDQPTSTITVSGTYTRRLVNLLLRQSLKRDQAPLSLVLQDLDTGTQTTIVKRLMEQAPSAG